MKKMIQKIKETEGYISVETIVIAGLVLAVGAIAFGVFQGKANALTNSSMNSASNAMTGAIANAAGSTVE